MGRNRKYLVKIIVILLGLISLASCQQVRFQSKEEIVDKNNKLFGIQIGDTITKVNMKLLEEWDLSSRDEGELIFRFKNKSDVFFGVECKPGLVFFENNKVSGIGIGITYNRINTQKIIDSLRKYLGSPEWFDERKSEYGGSYGLEWTGNKLYWRYTYDRIGDMINISAKN